MKRCVIGVDGTRATKTLILLTRNAPFNVFPFCSAAVSRERKGEAMGDDVFDGARTDQEDLVNPKPYTLKLAPCNLRPKSCTLNPAP